MFPNESPHFFVGACFLALCLASFDTLVGQGPPPITVSRVNVFSNQPQIDMTELTGGINAGEGFWRLVVDQGDFSIETSAGANFPTEPVFLIAEDANPNSLVITDDGNIAINRNDSQSSNEVEVFGNSGTQDTIASFAITPRNIFGDSGRVTVNTVTGNLAFGVKPTGFQYTNPLKIDLGAPSNALVVDGDGDVGLGTSTISGGVDLQVAGGIIKLDPSGTSRDWTVVPAASGLTFRNDNTSSVLFGNGAPGSSLVVTSDGDLGVGTPSPQASLEIRRDDTSAKLLVEETFLLPRVRNLLELANMGGVTFSLTNRDLAETWFFSNDSIGRFVISLAETGGPEFAMTPAGGFKTGPAGFAALNSLPNGNLIIGGMLSELSDRDRKENFEPVDCEKILQLVCDLPVTTWNYKSDDKSIRHLGPVAQDFHSTFQLGSDDNTIATSDKVGVSLVAIKALNEKLCERDKQIGKLKSQLANMAERMKCLEAKLSNLP